MHDIPDLDALNQAAADAAGRGDIGAAIGLLRQVLTQQIEQLGSDHPGLAPTLNNIGLMLERQGQLDDAEACYRGAYAAAQRDGVAGAALVETSRENLLAFLKANGRPEAIDTAPGAEGPTHAPPAQPPEAVPSRRSAPAPPPHLPEPRRATPSMRSRSGVIAGVGVLALIVLWLAVGRQSPPPPIDAPQPGPAEPPMVAAPPAAPPAAAPARPADPPVTSEAPASPPGAPLPPEPAPTPAPALAPTPPPERTTSARDITAIAEVCETLDRGSSRWRCQPLPENGTPSAVYYYTRVRTPRGVVVRHRWTHDGTVVQTVPLRISANMDTGYRTFSRQQMNERARGEWEVTLLDPNDAVIDQRRFVVP